MSVASTGEKVAAAVVAVTGLLLIAYVGVLILQFVFRHGGWKTRAGFWLLFATTLMVAGKFLDRLPAILAKDYGVLLPTTLKLFMESFEEGLEMVHPLLMIWAIWLGQSDGLFFIIASPNISQQLILSEDEAMKILAFILG